MSEIWETIGRFTYFAWRVLKDLPAAFQRPTDLADHCFRVGLGSLPLVAAAAVSIGLVSWLQTRSLLGDFGSESLLPGFIAVFVLVGMGPVVTGLVVAGQVGARLGAELGSMTITEQVHALEALGLSPIKHLAAGRVLAVTLMLPLLTVCLDVVALSAAFAAEGLGGDVSARQYVSESFRFLTLAQVVPATLSSLAFGLLIGLFGCWFGFEAGHGTEGVGKASTRSVVAGMFGVLAANVFWVQATSVFFS